MRNLIWFGLALLSLNPACSHRSVTSKLADSPIKEGFTYTYTNHQWNQFDLNFGSMQIKISTPQGDSVNAKRNLTFGFRPILIFNRVEINQTPLSIDFAQWADEFAESRYGGVFCQSVNSISSDPNTTFPLSEIDLAAKFGISSITAENTCAIKIARPKNRPGSGSNRQTPLNDLVCQFSPFERTGSGPKIITVYVPFQYVEKSTVPFLNEWPQGEIDVCVDGKLSKVSDLKPLGGVPTPLEPSKEPDFSLGPIGGQTDFLALARSFQGSKGVKYIFDRKASENKIYFQNTVKYPYHLPFMNEHIARFSGNLSAVDYEKLLFGAVPKEITGGEVFWLESKVLPGQSESGALALTLYYRDSLDLAELKSTFAKIASVTPFAKERLIFAFESQQDFFKYRNSLLAIGINSMPLSALLKGN